MTLDCPGFLVLFAPDGGSNYRDIFSLQSRYRRRKVVRWANCIASMKVADWEAMRREELPAAIVPLS